MIQGQAGPARTPSARGLYLHVPFCERKCAYCDFASWAGLDGEQDAWLDRILRELDLRAPEADGPLDTVFFGGGTPSALSAQALERLCRGVRERFAFSPAWEWSVEANPVSLDADKLAVLRDHGVGRVSLGVQSFDPELLALLGRAHDAHGAAAALDLVAASGLRWSADLIFALPGQGPDRFLASLERLLEWEPRHVSFYGLTVEDGTPFARARDRGELAEASEETYAESYVRGVERLARSGLERYEVSNFAVPGEECRHNLAYWDAAAVWLAAGNAAHGCRPPARWRNPRGLAAWSQWIDGGGAPEGRETEILDEEARWLEAWFLGLRTAKGVSREALVANFPDRRFPDGKVGLRKEAGHLEEVDGRLRLTGEGWLLLDAVVVECAA